MQTDSKSGVSRAGDENLISGAMGGEVVEIAPGLEIIFADRIQGMLPADRATEFRRNWADLLAKPDFSAQALKLRTEKDLEQILYDDKIILNVTEGDAAAQKQSRRSLAREAHGKLLQVLANRQRERDEQSFWRGLALAGGATVGLILFFILLARGYRYAQRRIDGLRHGKMLSLKIQNLEVLSAARATDVALWLLRWLRIGLILIALYVYLPIIFSFFPWTKNLADLLFGYIKAPVQNFGGAIVAYVPNLFSILVIWFVTRYLLKLVRIVFDEINRGNMNFPGFHQEWSDPTYKIIRFLILAFAVIMAFPYLPGSNSPAFQGVSIFLGVLFSMGSSSAIANLVAGTVLTYMRPFKIGDRVKIADTVGDVVERNMLVTRVRTIKNVDVTITNSMILGSHIINYSASAENPGLILHSTVTIGYDAPWRQVHQLLIAAAQETEGLLKSPEPFILQKSLDDWYVSYEINAYTDQPNTMAVIYSRLHQNIQDKFNEAGVEIMSPHFMGLRDGNAVNIPSEYLAKNYEAPAFGVRVRPEKSA
ncbi:MAG: mechanosensitive ion channel family protein [Turneriella sp.]|nr:mechanosensitive ion channel family protein [Turneriella sp.]